MGVKLIDNMLLHPAELRLILYMRKMGHGELSVKVQHGIPEYGEKIREKIKFNAGD